jgi:hypothetical protein
MSGERVKGSCLCGKVKFQVKSPGRASAHCHCEYCRLSSGAAFVTWVVIKDPDFELVAGEKDLRWYQSSKPSSRGFCSQCGSTLFFRSTLCPGEIHVTRANLIGEVEPAPQYNCFVDKAVHWVTIDSTGLRPLSSKDKEIAHYQSISAPDVLTRKE